MCVAHFILTASFSFRLCSLGVRLFEIQCSLWPNAWSYLSKFPKCLRDRMVYFKINFCFFVIVYVCICACDTALMEVWGWRSGVGSLLPPCWGSSLLLSLHYIPQASWPWPPVSTFQPPIRVLLGLQTLTTSVFKQTNKQTWIPGIGLIVQLRAVYLLRQLTDPPGIKSVYLFHKPTFFSEVIISWAL